MMAPFAIAIGVMVSIGITVPLLLQFVGRVSNNMSQSGINASQENTRLGVEG